MEKLDKKLLLIFNPTAGKGAIKGHLTGIIDTLTKGGYLVTAYPTQAKEDATQAVLELGKDYDRIVCCGGDGTLSETIAGILKMENAPVLGYLPTGSTNDFSKNLGLPKSLEESAQTMVSGPVHPCDVGLFNGRSFIYVAAFGAFTAVAYETPQEIKNTFGHLAYMLGGIAQLGTIKKHPMKFDYDDGHLEGDFLYGMASNTTSVGGFSHLLPLGDVDLVDGLFEVLLVRSPHSLAELNDIIQALLRQHLPDNGMVVCLHTAHLRAESPTPLPWTLDGEYGGEHETVEISAIHNAFNLVWGEAPE